MRYARSIEELHQWHQEALSNPDIERHEIEPQCGWYKMRRVKLGPWVPVLITVEQDIDPDTGQLADDERMRCEVDGINEDKIEEIWSHLKPISEAAFHQLFENRRSIPAMKDDYTPINLALTPITP
ncbi:MULTISPECIES: hypothetical protein [Halocynthiibacter]|uniref:Uncharacterized protein n=1 Tax=Halocynthiibacter halioticoli TaxID=2986804 RepID=A0AAE3J3A4_9RHOB|nr:MULTISPECIES: hypothetical protein [Halocynthiibacter]MCV6826028.1 hypothetical protein [Halocynthiibacter halioticoli]MCW4059029.1 hypothetical protein [Halocynthiibacter sp. SDUM655004]